MLLAFRANRAYDRWWEARILWGTLVNTCRNLAVKANAMVHQPDTFHDSFQRLITSFPYALRDHLRAKTEHESTLTVGGKKISARHLPSAIISQIYETFETRKKEERIQFVDYWTLDEKPRYCSKYVEGASGLRKHRSPLLIGSS